MIDNYEKLKNSRNSRTIIVSSVDSVYGYSEGVLFDTKPLGNGKVEISFIDLLSTFARKTDDDKRLPM